MPGFQGLLICPAAQHRLDSGMLHARCRFVYNLSIRRDSLHLGSGPLHSLSLLVLI
jgi:hypothetical protein